MAADLALYITDAAGDVVLARTRHDLDASARHVAEIEIEDAGTCVYLTPEDVVALRKWCDDVLARGTRGPAPLAAPRRRTTR